VLTTAATARSTPRWIAYIGLWLLLSCVFASQLYLAGYVTPWPRAFAAEAVYWFSWALLAPAVFWMCRRLYRLPWTRYAPALLMGAIVAAILQPLIPQLLQTLQSWLHLCIGPCETLPPWFSGAWLTQTVRVAGVNLPVYAGVVLAWHAAWYYRESRDRQLQAMQLESLLNQAQLQALRSQLGLSDGDVRHSATVLREFGNISSPTVFFVLERALADTVPDGLWWMSSFGAGFSCHGALLEVKGKTKAES